MEDLLSGEELGEGSAFHTFYVVVSFGSAPIELTHPC